MRKFEHARTYYSEAIPIVQYAKVRMRGASKNNRSAAFCGRLTAVFACTYGLETRNFEILTPLYQNATAFCHSKQLMPPAVR